MVSTDEVQAQFKKLGFKPSFWTRPELRELPKILVPGEQLTQIATGWYKGGFALLCCTDQRVLLIDKKMLFLTLEDFRYDMIAEVMYQYRLLDASVTMTYAATTLQFKSMNHGKLRQLATYVQQRIMEVRRFDQQQSAIHYYPQPAMSAVGIYGVLSDGEGNHQQRFASVSMPQFQPQPPVQVQAQVEQKEPMAANLALPKNPYQLRPYFHRRRVSRFVTSSQLAK